MILAGIAAFFFVLKTIIVSPGPGQPVQTALQKASKGDTILVTAGIYSEGTIRITKSVVLKGLDKPVLDGAKKHEILVIDAPNVTVEGFVFQNSGFSGYEDIAAIRLYQCRGSVVRHNTLIETFFGIYAEFASNARIEHNRMSSTALSETVSGNGIHAWKSDSLYIADNFITGHRDGIYFEFVTNSIAERNFSTGNVRYGIHFMFSNDDRYFENRFENNGAGIAVMYSKRIDMSRNRFLNNLGDAAYGVLFKDISDSRVTHNIFENNTIGAVLEGSSRIAINTNVFSKNGWAIKMQANCEDVVVQENNFFRNSFDVATNGMLVLNKFQNNYWDKYEGFDLDQDGTGDVPHTPTSLFAVIVERTPIAMMLYRSAIVYLLDHTEKLLPGITPKGLKDFSPSTKPHAL